MLNNDLISPLVISTLSFSIALFVLFASKKKRSNTFFVLFATFQSLWIVSNYFSNDFTIGRETALLANHLTLFFSGLCVLFLNMFAIEYCQDKRLFNHIKAILFVGIIINITALSPLVIKSIEKQEGVYALNFGPLYLAYFIVLLANALSVFLVLTNNYRNETGTEKEKLKFILISLISGIGAISITNIFMPLFFDSFVLTDFGQFGSLLIVFGIAYTIARHKMFDIKALVARSFVYTITTTVLVTLYSAISLPIKNFLISINTESYISTIVEIVLLGIFGVSFYPLKLYFDRVTTKYFFRDHYNTQEVLRSINAILSDSVDLDRMLHRVGGILRSTLHVEYCSFMIDENDGETSSTRHINIGRAIHRVTIPEDLEKLLKKSNVVVTEQLRDDDEFEKDQKQQLIRQDIAGVVKLKGVDEHGHIENEGFLILGNKKSGRGFSGQDEKMLEILSGQFAVAIQNLVHLDEIVHFNIKLQEEVTDATKELKVKNKKLRELDQTKDEFVSMASHQLRTPLTSVKGYLSMVLDGDAGELKPAQKQLLDQAYISTQRMVYLIADLLNLSRLKTGKFMINPQPTNLAHMIEGEIHQIEQTARASDLKVSFMCDPSIPDLMLDDMKTRQVIMNFIDNAIYYTPKGGSIEVYLEKEDGKAIFKVSDSGIGVAKEDQKELFGKFFRAGNARKARPDGTGLGLYMAKMVIDAQGGKILFSSQEGKGSTFGFSFDIKQLQVRPDTQNLPVTPEL